MKGTLELNGMRFHAYHGCLDFEKEQGGEYIVDFSAEIDAQKAFEKDTIESTIDYSAIYDIVKQQMDIPSSLIENVTARIMTAISDHFPLLEHYSVRVQKLNPPVAGPVEKSCFTLKR